MAQAKLSAWNQFQPMAALEFKEMQMAIGWNWFQAKQLGLSHVQTWALGLETSPHGEIKQD